MELEFKERNRGNGERKMRRGKWKKESECEMQKRGNGSTEISQGGTKLEKIGKERKMGKRIAGMEKDK